MEESTFTRADMLLRYIHVIAIIEKTPDAPMDELWHKKMVALKALEEELDIPNASNMPEKAKGRKPC